MVSVRGVTTQSVKILSTESANTGAVASVTMLLVGLTGGIGSGKSTVAELLRQKGAVVVDADEVARAVVEPGEPALAALVERFGPRSSTPTGVSTGPRSPRSPSPTTTAARPSGDITWPAIGEEFERRIKEAPDDAVVVCDVPLLVESKDAADPTLRGGHRGGGAGGPAPGPARGPGRGPRRRRAADGGPGHRRRAAGGGHPRRRQRRRPRRHWPARSTSSGTTSAPGRPITRPSPTPRSARRRSGITVVPRR